MFRSFRIGALFLTVFAFGCTSLIQQRNFDYKTTGLCANPADRNLQRAENKKKDKGFFQAVNPNNVLNTDNEGKKKEDPGYFKECKDESRIELIQRFMSIVETDEKNGVVGDTVEQVRDKGFSIFLDPDGKIRRQNTQELHGNEALSAIGMPVNPPQLGGEQEIRNYTAFMNAHFGHIYNEKGLRLIKDRFCVNTRNSLDIGDDYQLVIVWRDGHVFKRVVKGGPINNPKQEYAILLCPGELLSPAISSGISGAAKIK